METGLGGSARRNCPEGYRMEEVGIPETFEQAVELVHPGGHVGEAYDVFSRPSETGALKVLLTTST